MRLLPDLPKKLAFAILVVLCFSSPLRAQQRSNPASMQSFQIPSHGALLNAFVYVAAGAGPHPVVVLLHGFPGNERNLDLAQDIRRAGWDVLYFDYRGSWGSPGDFSFYPWHRGHGCRGRLSTLPHDGQDPAPGPIPHRSHWSQHGRIYGSAGCGCRPKNSRGWSYLRLPTWRTYSADLCHRTGNNATIRLLSASLRT